MREALTVIAEIRDSHRLREFLETGRDSACSPPICRFVLSCGYHVAEELPPENTVDMPRGLNQLGNTCYLNSLLQVISRVVLPCSILI